MKKSLLLIVSLLFYCFCISQKASVKGVITDTYNKQSLSNTTILLLRAKDSILVKFARSKTNGSFEIKNLKSGKYILLITYPQYADYADNITLADSSSIVDAGVIPLILKANLLKEVIVTQKMGSIRIKGDTTEFIADSFRVQPNATVEDLLKKLPGIQVDKNGKITAQGETVQKVLVDGEEFFGDDPTLVTQNLRADMVGSVQLYDKKSDQAVFTGIDDGTRVKTLNLKLKDGKKNGYFGKVNLSGGTNGYFDNQLMVNIFKNKAKFAAYGIISNTGKTGLNWQESSSYGDNPLSGADYDETNGSFNISGTNDELDSWSGNYNGQGLPTVQTGGLHYNTKWDNDKKSINGNYKILQLHIEGESGYNSQTLLHDTVYYNKDNKKYTNQILRNKVNGSYEAQIDSSTSIKITADGSVDHKIDNTIDSSEERFTDSSLVNQSVRSTNTIGDKRIVNSNIIWRKKFKKIGRTLSFNLNENYSNNNSTGYLKSMIKTFAGGNPTGILPTDQYKTYKTENTAFDTKLTYSEPLSKYSSLVFNYGIVIDNSSSQRTSYNKAADGKYSLFDSIYSNDYRFNILTQRGGIAYSYNSKKLHLNAGNNIGYTHFIQTDQRADSSKHRNFLNWSPQANVSYQFSKQSKVSFRYNGNTRQPSIEQIQPVQVNDNPLYITIGNPNLKPSFSNSLNLNFYDYKVLSDRSIWLTFSYNFTQNQISNSSTIDASGKTTTQYINLDGNHSFSTYLNYGFKLKKLDTRMGFNGNYSTNRNVNISNSLLNITKSDNYTGVFYINKDKEKKYSISLQAFATYTNSESSLQSSIKTQYWTYQIQPGFDIFLPLKFQIHADGDYNIRQKTAVFQSNNNVFLLNAWFGKKLMKNDALLLKISGNDILNQNIGFDRSVNNNIISQNTYTTIRRFFLLSAVWNFNKAGIKVPGQNN
jgi:hypothetical protein